MKRCNLSDWAVSHPTLSLFLMIMQGAAGFFSYQRLRDLARRHRAGNADPGRRPHREEAAGTAVLREGADLFKTVVHGDAGHVQGFDAAEGRALSVLSAAQEARRRAGPVARRPARADRQ